MQKKCNMCPEAHSLGAPPPDPRYQSSSVNTFKKNKLDMLAPGKAMHHPDGLLGKMSFFVEQQKRPCEVTRCTGRLAFIRS